AYDYFSQSCVGLMAGALEYLWEAACEIAKRVGGDPGFTGMPFTDGMPAAQRPASLAMLQTDGWRKASVGAKQAFERKVDAMRSAGVHVAGRHEDAQIEAFEALINEAMDLTWRIMSWELRWPVGADLDRNAWGVSRPVLGRFEDGLAMTREDYARALSE